MLKIRLSMGGVRKRPVYKIVVADSRAPRDGRFVEKIGLFNPLLPKDKKERIKVEAEDEQKAAVAHSTAHPETPVENDKRVDEANNNIGLMYIELKKTFHLKSEGNGHLSQTNDRREISFIISFEIVKIRWYHK